MKTAQKNLHIIASIAWQSRFFLDCFVVLLFAMTTLTQSILAQSAMGTTAIPPRLEITAEPGQVVTKEIKVRNESKTQRTINTTIKDFIVTDDQGTPIQVDSDDNRWAASSWLQVSPSKLQLKAGETKSLQLTVITPDDALPGGHYAVVLHTPQNEITLSETGSAIETNVGTLVYITIPGDIKESARVKDFSAPFFSEYGPIDFKAVVTNLSDIHIAPIGSVSITNLLGSKTADLAIPETNIFPYTSRNLNTTLNKKWLFGRYKAQLLAGYGTTGNALTATLYFWVVPWRLIITLVAIIVILLILIYLAKKKKDSPKKEKIEELETELSDLKKKYKDR